MTKEQHQKEQLNKRTRRAGKLFPYYDLDACIVLANEIKKGGVDKLEEGVLAKALHSTIHSSAFKAKATSARHYGLIIEKKGEGKKFWLLTEDGKKITSPYDEKEEQQLEEKAFLNFSVWKDIYEKYFENGELPSMSTLESILEREYGISPVSKSKACRILIECGKQAGLFHEEDGVIKYSQKLTERKDRESGKELEKKYENFATLNSDEFSFRIKKDLSAIEFARSQINSFLDYWKSKLSKENRLDK